MRGCCIGTLKIISFVLYLLQYKDNWFLGTEYGQSQEYWYRKVLLTFWKGTLMFRNLFLWNSCTLILRVTFSCIIIFLMFYLYFYISNQHRFIGNEQKKSKTKFLISWNVAELLLKTHLTATSLKNLILYKKWVRPQYFLFFFFLH